MSDFSRWAAMGGYAAFVWPAYGVAFAILGGVAAQSWSRYRASRRMLDQLPGGSRSRP